MTSDKREQDGDGRLLAGSASGTGGRLLNKKNQPRTALRKYHHV